MNRASFFTLIVVLVVWQLITTSFDVPRYIFPSISVVVQEIVDHPDPFVRNTAITAVESLLGAMLGCAIGLLLGCVMALNKWAQNILLPYAIGSNSVPVVAVAPLVAIWFGHGLMAKIVVAAFLCFFPIAVNTYEGLRDRSVVFRELFLVIGARSDFYFWQLRVPLAVPFIVAGAKVSVVLAVIGAVVAEFVGADAGLGFGMVQASYSLNTPRLFGYVIMACILGLVFYGAVVLAEVALRSSGRWDWAFGGDENAESGELF
jgi:NitT/TauT family transport system permease protein